MVDRTIVKQLLGAPFKDFISTYQTAINIFLAIATIIVISLIVFHITRIASAGDNPHKREEAQDGLKVCLICFFILANIDIVYFYVISFVLSDL